jgi:hypothetical protein
MTFLLIRNTQMSMNSRLEAILNERGKGSIAQWMEAQSIIETVNDGDNYYGQIEINLQDSSLPTPATNNMMLRLTDPGFHITQFTESFIVIRLKLVLQCFAIVDGLVILPNPVSADDKLVKYLFDNQYIFVGYKGSNQAIHDYQL